MSSIPNHLARRVGALALLVGAAVAATASSQGCSALTNTTAVQCSSEAQCLSLGADFVGTTCDPATKTCVKVAQGADLCTTNQQCIDQAGGQPALCRKGTGKCVKLITPECPEVFAQPGEIANDRAIAIGMISPQGASFCANACDAIGKTVQLGQAELSKTLRGLPAVDGSNEPRPVIVVSCHEFTPGAGYEGLLRMANHLAKDVGVPLVIGPIDGANALVVETTVFNPAKVLSIVPGGTSFALGQQPNPIAPTPIIWRPSISDVLVSKATGQLVEKFLEPRAKQESGDSSLRVAVLVEHNSLGLSLSKSLQDTWRFNGQLARDNPAANFQIFDIGDFLDTVGNPAPETKIQGAIGALYAFKPHIVAHAYAPAAISPTFFPLILNWPAGQYVPYHIDVLPSSFSFFQPIPSVLNLVPALKGRVFTTDTRPPADNAHRAAWILKFVTTYPEFRGTPIPEFVGVVEGWYDAFYLAAYSIAANRNKPLTGENLAATLPLLNPPGALILTGTEDMAKAVGALNNGQGIDLQGIAGDLDIDTQTGATAYDILVQCAAQDATGKTTGFKSSGFFTDKGAVQGAPSCL